MWAIAARGRPEEVFAEFDAASQFEGATVELCALQPLSEVAVLAVAADVLGAPPTGRGRGWFRRVGGNPFLAIQLAEGMARERTDGGSAEALPEALSATIRSRMRRLDSGALAALQLAAVWGRSLDIADAASMLGLDATTSRDR